MMYFVSRFFCVIVVYVRDSCVRVIFSFLELSKFEVRIDDFFVVDASCSSVFRRLVDFACHPLAKVVVGNSEFSLFF